MQQLIIWIGVDGVMRFRPKLWQGATTNRRSQFSLLFQLSMLLDVFIFLGLVHLALALPHVLHFYLATDAALFQDNSLLHFFNSLLWLR